MSSGRDWEHASSLKLPLATRLIDFVGFPKPTVERVTCVRNRSSCGVAFTLVKFLVESVEALNCRGFFKALRKSSTLMELCGPTRQRVIDIVGSVVRPCETISENVKQVNEAFEMPEIELCPTIRFKIRPIRLRWEALEQKKCKENIQLLPTHNYIFASLRIKFLRINSANKNSKIEDIRALVQSSWTCSHTQRISSSLRVWRPTALPHTCTMARGNMSYMTPGSLNTAAWGYYMIHKCPFYFLCRYHKQP